MNEMAGMETPSTACFRLSANDGMPATGCPQSGQRKMVHSEVAAAGFEFLKSYSLIHAPVSWFDEPLTLVSDSHASWDVVL